MSSLEDSAVRCITLLATGLLVGCASHADVAPVDGGRYLVSVAGTQSPTDAAEIAGERAENFCADRGEGVHILGVTNGTRFMQQNRMTVVFRCIAP
jgi:hypothetical protein